MPRISDVVVESSLSALTCLLNVPGDLPVCTGHFPAVPIIPGVVQLGWAVDLARKHGLASGPLVGIASAKFRRVLQPGVELRARLHRGRSAGELQFEFMMGDLVVSCGRLRFGDQS